ncbi:hypothetical protein DH09_02685 [Bacillaceae bacterium JMAK1]|nr:hypothetical protein DH09_02685 [Bacillaceae bacterium JMAK1]
MERENNRMTFKFPQNNEDQPISKEPDHNQVETNEVEEDQQKDVQEKREVYDEKTEVDSEQTNETDVLNKEEDVEEEQKVEHNETINVQEKRKEWEQREGSQYEPVSMKKAPGLPFHKKRKFNFPKKRNKMPIPFQHIKMTGLIVLALAIGSLFGLPLLQVVTTSSPTDSAEQWMLSNEEESAPVQATEQSENDQDVQLSVDVVQAGAFSTVEAGQSSQQQLESEGYTSVLHAPASSDHVFLYVAVAASGQAADEYLPAFEADGLDVFVKSLDLTSTNADEEQRQATEEVKQIIEQALTSSEINSSITEQSQSVLQSSEEGSALYESLADAIENAEQDDAWVQAVVNFDGWLSSL